MTEQKGRDKNALCDLLMKEGLVGFQNEENVARAALLTGLAQDLGREDGLKCVLSWFEALDKKNIQGEHSILLDYNWANAIAGNRYGTQWKWDQPTLAREIYLLRRAVSHPRFSAQDAVFRCMCLNNLGKRLEVAGRSIEALDCWGRALEVNPNFGMSLCNRAKALAQYGGALGDEERALFLWAAHREAEAALAPTAIYTSTRDEASRRQALGLKQWIESFLDVKGLETVLSMPDGQETPRTEEELAYRRWCLENRLYLNPANDICRLSIAAYDSMCLPAQVVPVDAPHIFDGFFDQMKQEFVSARWLLY